MACTCKVCSNPHCRRGNPLVPPDVPSVRSEASPGTLRRKTDARRYSELLAVTLGVCLALGTLSLYIRARHAAQQPAASVSELKPLVLQPAYPVKVFFSKTTGKCIRLVYADQEYACSEPIPGVLTYFPE